MHSQQEEPAEAYSTFNIDYLNERCAEKATELHKLKDRGVVDITKLNQQEQTSLNDLLRKMGTSFEQIRSHHDPSADTAIETMSMTHAYYAIASQRFCDQLPKEIDSRIFRTFATCFKESLNKELNALDGTTADLFPLVAPDRALLTFQEDMKARQERQQRALGLIDDYAHMLHSN